jgi:hypothetical protein
MHASTLSLTLQIKLSHVLTKFMNSLFVMCNIHEYNSSRYNFAITG